MTRVSPALAFVSLAFASGCSDPQGCGDTILGTTLVSEARVVGSRTFSGQGEREAVPLTFTLKGLPTRWPPEGPIAGDRIDVKLALVYGAGPSGVAEMPGIAVSYGGRAFGRSEPYPPSYGTTLTGGFFTPCRGIEGESCCEVGATTCTLTGELVIERLEGSPYPPLDVTWDISATASTLECLNDESGPRSRTLELSSP